MSRPPAALQVVRQEALLSELLHQRLQQLPAASLRAGRAEQHVHVAAALSSPAVRAAGLEAHGAEAAAAGVAHAAHDEVRLAAGDAAGEVLEELKAHELILKDVHNRPISRLFKGFQALLGSPTGGTCWILAGLDPRNGCDGSQLGPFYNGRLQLARYGAIDL